MTGTQPLRSQPSPSPGWTRLDMPLQVRLASLLGYGALGVCGFALMGLLGFVLEPMDGVTRREAVLFVPPVAILAALLLAAAVGIERGRSWGWPACVALALTGAVAGAAGTWGLAKVVQLSIAEPPTGMNFGLAFLLPAPFLMVACVLLLGWLLRSEARGWFAGQPATAEVV